MKNNRISSCSLKERVAECRRIFRPILFLLFIFGFDLGENPSFCRRCFSYCLRLLSFILTCGYFSFYLPYICINWNETQDYKWNLIMSTAEISQVTITYVVITIKLKSLVRCFKLCVVGCSDIIGQNSLIYQKLRKQVRKSAVYFIIFLIALSVMAPSFTSESEEGEEFVLNICLLNFFFTVSITISFCIHLLYLLFYTSLCNLLSQSFIQLNKDVGDGKEKIFISKISDEQNSTLRFIKAHRKLSAAVCLMDEVFNQVVAVWHLAQLVNVVFLLKEMQSLKVLETRLILGVVVSFIWHVKKCLAASDVNDKVLRSLKSKLDLEDQYYKVNVELEMHARYTELDPPSLNSLSLYQISRRFILSSAGSVITYVLVVYNIKG